MFSTVVRSPYKAASIADACNELLHSGGFSSQDEIVIHLPLCDSSLQLSPSSWLFIGRAVVLSHSVELQREQEPI